MTKCIDCHKKCSVNFGICDNCAEERNKKNWNLVFYILFIGFGAISVITLEVLWKSMSIRTSTMIILLMMFSLFCASHIKED